MEKCSAPHLALRFQHETRDPAGDRMDVQDDPAEEAVENEEFEQFLDDLHRRQQNPDNDNTKYPFHDTEDDDDETLAADADDNLLIPKYLGSDVNMPEVPMRDAFQNSYVHIVHTNGLYHLAMASCRCHGAKFLPRDLIAS